MLAQFSATTAQKLFNAKKAYPVNFSDAWQWLEYHDKPTGKRALLSCGFEEEIDYCKNAALPTASNPRPNECITLTVDCFKNWAMMSKTDTGKKVRKYFIECERAAKEAHKPESKRKPAAWVLLREGGINQRRSLTDCLQAAGATSKDYEAISNIINLSVLGMTAFEVRTDRGIAKSKPIRDYLTAKELRAIAMIEEAVAAEIQFGDSLLQIKLKTIDRAQRVAAAIA